MADVFAIFGILLFLGISFPGMLTAWWLLFPNNIERARIRLSITPWRCFWMGILTALIFGLPAFMLISAPSGAAKLVGWSLLALVLAGALSGAAGLTSELGRRLYGRSEDDRLPAGEYIRSAVILELAAAFPVIGWFLIIPITIITSLGAAVFALLRWMPNKKAKKLSSEDLKQTADGLSPSQV